MKKLALLYLLLVLISCGKDEVIIVDPMPPNEIDDLYEVNIIGFVTDEEGMSVPDATLSVDGIEITTDVAGVFYMDKVVVGKRGKVIQFNKEGYLPSIVRLSNHNSLEDVMVNLRVRKSSVAQTIGPEGGSLIDNFGEAVFEQNVLLNETTITFITAVNEDSHLINRDAIYRSDKTEFLLKSASIYIKADQGLVEGSEFTIRLDADKVAESDNLSVFHYDEALLTWKKRNITFTEKDGFLTFNGDAYGWWTLAENVPAVYATVALSQLGGEPISELETELTFGDNGLNTSNFYTNSSGSISTYFPEDEKLEFAINNKDYMALYSEGFDVGNTSATVDFDEIILNSFDGSVYSCDFNFSNGFVVLNSVHHRVIKPIIGGALQGDFMTDTDEIVFQFYTKDYMFLNERSLSVATLSAGTNRFFACADLNDNMMVLDGAELIEDFEDCRVKVNPKETLVIGEREIGEVFLVSFVGDKEGIYNGLIYSPLLTETEVQSNVEVNIILYDEIENKVGGFILTENISTGEDVKISFIGDIE